MTSDKLHRKYMTCFKLIKVSYLTYKKSKGIQVGESPEIEVAESFVRSEIEENPPELTFKMCSILQNYQI